MYSLLSWYAHRWSMDKLGWQRAFSRSGRRRVLILSERGPIPKAQIFPFIYYAAELGRAWNLEVREFPVGAFQAGRPGPAGPVDCVLFQTWFNLSDDDMTVLVERIRTRYPGAALVYLDWFAPTDLRYARVLDPYVQCYVKKHVLRDRSQYGRPTLGHTNLSDYYNRRLADPEPETIFEIPDGFLDKLVVGWNFACSPHLWRNLGECGAPHGARPIDVHARFATKGGRPWYTAMRGDAARAVRELTRFNVVHEGRVSPRKFLAELRASKLCFSPFGFGEVCWRDFEAILAGSVVIKPDMAHIETVPDVYLPNETYVPIRWDLTDMTETCRRYLADTDARTVLAGRARAVLDHFVRSGEVLTCIGALMERVGLPRAQVGTGRAVRRRTDAPATSRPTV